MNDYYTIVYSSEMEIMVHNVSNVTQMETELGSSMASSGSGSGDTDIIVLSVLVSGLDPFTNYTFYVLAVSVAPSKPNDGVTVLTDEAGKLITGCKSNRELICTLYNITGVCAMFICFLINSRSCQEHYFIKLYSSCTKI